MNQFPSDLRQLFFRGRLEKSLAHELRITNYELRINMATFPAYTPTTRSFSPGSFPSKTYTFTSGVTTRRLFGSSPSGFKLNLTFDNVPNAIAQSIYSFFLARKGMHESFLLPSAVWNDLDESFIPIAQGNDYSITWRFESPPEVSSNGFGLSSVSVNLIGGLEA